MSAPGSTPNTVTFRWLGAAGIELRVGASLLMVDPFVTRPPVARLLLGRPRANRALIRRYLPACDHVFVTHAHYDHVMDVPELVQQTGAMAYVPPNASALLRAHQVPRRRIHTIGVGERLTLPPFAVTTYSSDHVRLPGQSRGPVAGELKPPLHVRDYRMSLCLSLAIRAGGLTMVRSCTPSGPALAADVFFVGAEGTVSQYEQLLRFSQSPLVIPVHWDDFFRPIAKPVRARLHPPRAGAPIPRRIDLGTFAGAIHAVAPEASVLVPEPFRLYELCDICRGDFP